MPFAKRCCPRLMPTADNLPTKRQDYTQCTWFLTCGESLFVILILLKLILEFLQELMRIAWDCVVLHVVVPSRLLYLYVWWCHIGDNVIVSYWCCQQANFYKFAQAPIVSVHVPPMCWYIVLQILSAAAVKAAENKLDDQFYGCESFMI